MLKVTLERAFKHQEVPILRKAFVHALFQTSVAGINALAASILCEDYSTRILSWCDWYHHMNNSRLRFVLEELHAAACAVDEGKSSPVVGSMNRMLLRVVQAAITVIYSESGVECFSTSSGNEQYLSAKENARTLLQSVRGEQERSNIYLHVLHKIALSEPYLPKIRALKEEFQYFLNTMEQDNRAVGRSTSCL